MNLWESIVYGIVSGFSEFLPVSSLGHQEILKIFFGASSPEPLRDMMIHIAFLAAVLVGCSTYIDKLRQEYSQSGREKRRRSGGRDRRSQYDLMLLKSTSVLMVIVMAFFRIVFPAVLSLNWLAFAFLISGLIIFIPEYLPQGNKDSRKMSGFDSFLLAVSGALCVIPGFSRVGGALSSSVSRGADKLKAYNWILILTIPSVIIFLIFDVVAVFQVGFGVISFTGFLGYIVSGIFAFVSAMAGIYCMRFMLVRSGVSPFAFYNWGVALLTFLLHLSA